MHEISEAAKSEAKRRVRNLVHDYITVLTSGKKEDYDGERLKIAFVVPLMEALGWQPVTNEIRSHDADLDSNARFILEAEGNRILVEVKSPNENLDEYSVTKDGVKSCAELAFLQALKAEADWVFLTNFDEARLYCSRVQRAEDGLLVKLKFTEYESKFDDLWLMSKEGLQSGVLEQRRKGIEQSLEDDPVVALLKAEGPLNRKRILEKLGLSQVSQLPWYIKKLGSRKRKIYYLAGQEEEAKKAYEDMLKPKPKPPSFTYPADYFISLLNLKRQRSPYTRSSDGVPVWWERRANRQYACSLCKHSIEKGQRYIGRRKLIPGVRGIYGHRGSYVTDCFHIVCLLRKTQGRVAQQIGDLRHEVGRLESEIVLLKEQIPAKRARIETYKSETQMAKQEYELAGFWRKFDRWVNFHLTSWSRGSEILRLEKDIVDIQSNKIPERDTEIGELSNRIAKLAVRLRTIERRIEELAGLS